MTLMHGSEGHFFVSYARSDAPAVRPIVEALREEGVVTWMDDTLPVGSDWPAGLRHQVETARGLLLFMSPRSAESAWVGEELAAARAIRTLIIPCLLDGTPWEELQHLHYLDCSGGSLPPGAVDLLLSGEIWRVRAPLPAGVRPADLDHPNVPAPAGRGRERAAQRPKAQIGDDAEEWVSRAMAHMGKDNHLETLYTALEAWRISTRYDSRVPRLIGNAIDDLRLGRMLPPAELARLAIDIYCFAVARRPESLEVMSRDTAASYELLIVVLAQTALCAAHEGGDEETMQWFAPTALAAFEAVDDGSRTPTSKGVERELRNRIAAGSPLVAERLC